jgi:lysophospholipase L1-like esterase
MSTLLAIGDSHTFGAEILGEGNHYDIENQSLAWPAKLGKLLNFDNVINLGSSGGGNMRIERKLVEYLATNPKPNAVIIGWTTLGRFEYCDSIDNNGNYVYNRLSSWDDRFDAETDFLNDTENGIKIKECYNTLKSIVTAEDLLAQKYRHIITAQTLCDWYKIPLLMFDVMAITKNTAPVRAYDTDHNLIDDSYKLWEGTNKMDMALFSLVNQTNYMTDTYWEYIFTASNLVKINGGHANEVGHQVWAERLSQELIDKGYTHGE